MKAQIEGEKQFEILTVNRYEVEENAIFQDYNVESLLKEIQNYTELKFHMRMSMVKNIKPIQQVLKEHQNQFSSLLNKIAADHEELQVELMKYFKEETPFKTKPHHYKQFFLDPLLILAKGPFLQIKEESCGIISQLAHKLEAQQIKSIIEFADVLADSVSEQNKIAAIQLLAKLTPDMSPERKQSLFEVQFMNIHKNASVRVKKQIILELGRLASNLDKQFVQKRIIKEFYLKQVEEHAWGIRKACVEILTDLIQFAESCREELSNVLLTLLKDGNKFVRIAAHKSLPEFIAKYGSNDVPETLFNYYITLIDLDINNQVSRNNEIIQKIAFYFPGVLYRGGKQKWPQLKKLFNRLLHNKSEEIKLPIAQSLFEIGKIIGPQQSKQTLFGALDFILKQPSDHLKLCAIKNLTKFVEQFQKQTKQNLIDVFLVLQKDPKKWRVRHSISNQLKNLSHIYDSQTVFKYIFPISLKLCNDGVSEVRNEAASQIVHVVNNFKSEALLYEMAIESLKGYAASQKYIQRQTFCLMLESLYQETEQFSAKFKETIEALAKDPIPTVRICLAISINNIIQHHKLDRNKFSHIIQTLSKDAEVASYFEDQ